MNNQLFTKPFAPSAAVIFLNGTVRVSLESLSVMTSKKRFIRFVCNNSSRITEGSSWKQRHVLTVTFQLDPIYRTRRKFAYSSVTIYSSAWPIEIPPKSVVQFSYARISRQLREMRQVKYPRSERYWEYHFRL